MSSALSNAPAFSQRSPDPRADGAFRVVELRDGMVVILRSVGGVRMRVAVPLATYRDLAIRIRMPGGSAELVLRHSDVELNVSLLVGEPDDVARLARDWSTTFGKAIAIERAFVTVQGSFARTKKRRSSARRSAFARSRTVGGNGLPLRCFSSEHEIIART